MTRSLFPRFVGAACVAVFCCPLPARAGDPTPDAKTPSVDIGNQVWSQPTFGTGVKTSDVYTDGHVFVTAPLWSTIGRDGTLGGDYLFIEPYSSLGDQGELATSLGLGWRHLFSDQPNSKLKDAYTASFLQEGWYVGGNVFVDMLRTHSDNEFWQLGMGVELGSRYVKLRGNYYLPFNDDPKLASQSESEQTFVSQSSSTSEGSFDQRKVTFGNPFATGNAIDQTAHVTNTVFNTATTTTTTTDTTVKTITSIFEEGMQGWDAELALLMPWVDQWMDVKVLGGYYRFNNQPFGPQSFGTGDVRGWKSGVEIRPVPAVVLDGIWYSDKALTGSNWVVGISLEIPMDKTWKDAFKMRRRHLVEDLAEPVHRMNDAVKVGNSENQNSTASSTSSTASQTIVLGNTTTHRQKIITIKNDIIFVNDGSAVGNGIQAGSATGNGTAEHPVNTIQSGATLAGTNSNNTGAIWTAYVQGGGPTYTGTVTTIGSTNYLGSSQPITARGGKVFGGTGPNPTLDGAIVADGSINPAIKAVSIQGFTILHGSLVDGFAPIQITDVPSVRITNNTIQDSVTDAIDVTVDDAKGALTSTVVITNNTITQPQGDGIGLIAADGGAVMVALVQNNVITEAGADGIGLLTSGTGGSGGQITATITGNVISFPTGNGITLEAPNNGTSITANVSNNTISDTSDGGIVANSGGVSTLTLVANNNILTDLGGDGIDVGTDGATVANFSASGNQITGAAGDGIFLNTIAGSLINANITGNTLTGSGSNGIQAAADVATPAGTLKLIINSNSILKSGSSGIFLDPGLGTISVNALTTPVNNVITGSGAGSMNGNTAGNTGTIIINGALISLPNNAP